MRNKILFVYVIIAVVIFICLPGIRAAHDFPYIYKDIVLQGLSLPQVWSDTGYGLGQSTILTLWSWPIGVLYAFGTKIGIEFSALSKLLGIIPAFIVGIFSINYFLKSHGFISKHRWIPAIFYLFNTYFLLLIDGGQLGVALAFAWFPLAYALFEKSPKILLSALAVVILGFLDIRFVYILIILLGLRALLLRAFIRRFVYKGLLTSVLFLLFNAYWILPALLGKPVSASAGMVSQASQFSFANLGHAFLVLQPHWWGNRFGMITPLRTEFYLLAFLAFLAPLIKSKNKEVVFWFLIALIAAFLVKGTNPPFGNIYLSAFTYLPGFSFFRDSTKFFFLLILSYTFLIGITVENIITINKKFRIVILGLFAFYIFTLLSPIVSGKMTGLLTSPENQQQYFQSAEYLEQDTKFSRIAWFPTRPLLGYSSSRHPLLEGHTLYNLRPFAIGVVGSYEVFNFLRETPFVGQILNIASVGYIGYPFPDTPGKDLSKEETDYYHTFLNQLKKLSWIEGEVSNYPVSVLKTTNNQDRFFVSPNTFYIVGSDRIYWDLPKNFDLSQNALIFVEEEPGTLQTLEQGSSAKVILYDKKPLDAQLALVDYSKFIFPASKLNRDPDSTGWWKREASDLISWRDFLQQKYEIDNLDFDYGGGWAVSEGEHFLNLSSQSFSKGKTLFIRTMESSRSGNVEIYQDSNLIGKVNTKLENPEKVEIKLSGNEKTQDQIFNYDTTNVRWFEVGQFVSSSPITMRTQGEINVVNSIVALDKQDLKPTGDYFTLENADFNSPNNAKISYSRLAPTHYKVKVEGLTAPATLVFSETFDSTWELNGQKPTKLYSLVNGFNIEKDGEYDLYFSAQQYVLPGLIISLATAIIVIILLKKK